MVAVLALCAAAAPEEQRKTASSLLDDPFAVGRINFFHSALEVPPLESARTMEEYAVYLRLRSTHARSNFHEGAARTEFGEDDFDGTFHEFASLSCNWTPAEQWELSARAAFAGWDEHQDRFELFNDAGGPIVRFEERKILGIGATSRHANMSVVGVGLKRQILDESASGVDLATRLSGKIPFGRDRDLTNAGTYDVAGEILAGTAVPGARLHAQLGVTVPMGDQTLFNKAEGIDLNPFVFAAVGVTRPFSDSFALGLQLEANTSAFRDVDFLSPPAAEAVLGARKLWGATVLEVGTGAGMDWESSYQWMGFLSIGHVY